MERKERSLQDENSFLGVKLFHIFIEKSPKKSSISFSDHDSFIKHSKLTAKNRGCLRKIRESKNERNTETLMELVF